MLALPDDLLVSAPAQIFSLFKLLEYPLAGDRHGDRMDAGFNRVPAHGRTIIDVGLHFCESLAEAVQQGFVVHGFEPVPAHMEHCRRRLNASQYLEVDVSSTPQARQRARHGKHYRQRDAMLRGREGGGFAFLYGAAVSNVTAFLPFDAAGGSSTLGKVPLGVRRGAAGSGRLTVPAVRGLRARGRVAAQARPARL